MMTRNTHKDRRSVKRTTRLSAAMRMLLGVVQFRLLDLDWMLVRLRVLSLYMPSTGVSYRSQKSQPGDWSTVELRLVASFIIHSRRNLQKRDTTATDHLAKRHTNDSIETKNNRICPLLTDFNLLKLTGHVMHQQLNIQQLYALPTLYLCVFIYLRTNSDLCHLQHKLIGFCKRHEKCLLCGTNCVFK